ncbi:MAG: hypothetical protein WC285_04375, partial [Candidatus Gracilibacteria bacterium]
MRKLFTKKRLAKMWITAVGFIMVVILYWIFSLVVTHELYQPCREFTVAGGSTGSIAGIDEITGDYSIGPAISCKNTIGNADD